MSDEAIDLSNHLLTLDKLSRESAVALLDRADEIIRQGFHQSHQLNTLQDKTMATLFYEPSTRTRISFELAATRLGAQVVNLDIAQSSTRKGEALVDTVRTLQAMSCRAFIIRHQKAESAAVVAKHLGASATVINAGDGQHAHPTQALLGLLTIRQHKSSFDKLKVAIVGDIYHSRVAHSAIAALTLMGVAELRLVGPLELLEKQIVHPHVVSTSDINEGLDGVDVVIALRIQKERLENHIHIDEQEYFENYGIDNKKLSRAKKDAIVMHPGPMNRGVEIDSAVADGEQSVILQQVANGVAMRMAVLEHYLK